jgi:RNA polymerase sigma-70 factor (ECF subfamily)
MTNELDLSNLLNACRRGDPQAQRKLFDRHHERLLVVCLRYARDYPEAEDMLQETFLALFRDLHQFNGQGPFEGWSHRVAVNSALQYLRRRNPLRFADELDPVLPEHHRSVPHAAEGSPDAVLYLVQQLPAGYRTVFNLHCMEAYSYAEIAEQLGISESSVRSQYARACKQLRLWLEQTLVHHP